MYTSPAQASSLSFKVSKIYLGTALCPVLDRHSDGTKVSEIDGQEMETSQLAAKETLCLITLPYFPLPIIF